MSQIKQVTSEQFEEIKELLFAAETLKKLMKKPGLSLEQKILLGRASRTCSSEALKIGESK